MDDCQRQRQLIDNIMANPACLPEPAERIERLETHLSTVLLAGDHAYKIKKPLDLGFVDYSTLARRRYFCTEEVRLNQRLAPSLYLRTVPITGSIDRPVFDGEGDGGEVQRGDGRARQRAGAQRVAEVRLRDPGAARFRGHGRGHVSWLPRIPCDARRSSGRGS